MDQAPVYQAVLSTNVTYRIVDNYRGNTPTPEPLNDQRLIREGMDICMAKLETVVEKNTKPGSTRVQTASGAVTYFTENDIEVTAVYKCTEKVPFG